MEVEEPPYFVVVYGITRNEPGDTFDCWVVDITRRVDMVAVNESPYMTMTILAADELAAYYAFKSATAMHRWRLITEQEVLT